MDENRFIKIYWQQYRLLEKRMIELSDYVEINPKNYATFSNQFISMYLMICSEIDSVADKFCCLLGVTDNKERFGINNKINKILEKYNNLKNWKCITKFPFDKINIVPFAKFNEGVSADWWQAYNKVKHSRAEQNENGKYNYELANLKNILFSLSALYLLISKMKEEFCKSVGIDMQSSIFDIDYIE
ncbi:MAG: hypothetical protein NC177_14580 [Ruminococcus flavefaciens]|nr:hypothetical protein [Ruminococcus flavefaciens]